jgi:hypothetical protein
MIGECSVDIEDDRKQARSLRGIAEGLWSVAIGAQRPFRKKGRAHVPRSPERQGALRPECWTVFG